MVGIFSPPVSVPQTDNPEATANRIKSRSDLPKIGRKTSQTSQSPPPATWATPSVSTVSRQADGVQLSFAKMLLKMSNDCKKEVDKYKGEIEEIQRKQKEAAAMVSEARLRISWCGDDKKKIIGMGPEMIAYFRKYNLTKGTEGDPKNYTNCFVKDQWEFNLKSLTNHQEQIGTETQTKMVFLQDLVGQYQANLTGAKTAVSESNDVLRKLIP